MNLLLDWFFSRLPTFAFALMLTLLPSMVSTGSLAADWPAYRGNNQRTGNVDGQPGPRTPNVLWVHKSNDDFVAAPVPAGKLLFVSALGPFNSSSLQAMATEPAPGKRIQWTKSAPYLKLPTVSSPSLSGKLLVFGDGMHQTDGAVLHGVRLDSGLPLWQLPVPGQLVHLEGSPAIADGKIYIGGGNAGVICVDPGKLQLDGQDVDSAAAQAILERRWQELRAKYEQEKKTDPDFAIPPSEDALPKPRPKTVWQAGSGQWHVDAPVALVGARLLACSAYLDQEKVGDRCLTCLNTADGQLIWKTPLKFNPWGGPTVVDGTVLLGSSSIRLEPADALKGQGEVLAVALGDGAVRWRKEIPGGVVSPIAVKDGHAVFTASDGNVRCWDVGSGTQKWIYRAESPLFAGPAIAGNIAYVGDLRGVLHAIGLNDGKKLWTLDTAAHPLVASPGMIYGSPVVDAGRLYLATCNLTKSATATQSVVICLGDK